MIGYRLEGIPDEYFEHMIVPDNITEDALTKTIERVLSLDKDVLAAMGESAKDFILNKKNAKSQVLKMLDFLGDKN